MIDSLRLISIDSLVLERAAEPFPTSLGALDAIHLDELTLATHDVELGLAGHAVGFVLQGLPLSP
jgi:hypothetical protein